MISRPLFSLPLVLLALLYSESGLAGSPDRGHGRVNVQGSVIETPCAIDTQSRDQTVDMGATPVSTIARDGHGASRAFSIRLIHCHLARLNAALPDWRYFRVMFDGPDDGGWFGLGGSARGVALQVEDARGNLARPGEPLPPGALSGASQQLDYTLRLVSNGQLPRAGNFRTALRFRIDYY